MIRTYQRRHKGGSNSQPDAFSPFDSDSQDLIGSYHSAVSSQEGSAALDFSDPLKVPSQQPPVARLGSLSSRLDLFAFEDDEDTFGEGLLERRESALDRQGSQGGSPAKRGSNKQGGTTILLPRSSVLDEERRPNEGPKGGLAKSPLLAGSFGRGMRHFSAAALQSTSLMEHQESGEMQESVDEAKFALEGLTPRSSPAVVRASLVALAKLLATPSCRRVLRAHGLGKPLLTAIVTLPADHAPRLASAAIVYFLSVDDVPHRSLLDSDDVIRLVLGFLHGGNEVGRGVRADGVRAVQELFRKGDAAAGGSVEGHSVTPAWLGLLALERASMAAAQLEQEASIGGAKSSNRFKDRLREQGGLSTICHLAASCQAALHDDVTGGEDDVTDVSGGPAAMLLRCLRVLEHVTYVSEENQKHLLQLRISERGCGVAGGSGGAGKADSCVDVVLGCIEALGLGQTSKREAGGKEKGGKTEKALRQDAGDKRAAVGIQRPESNAGNASWGRLGRQPSVGEEKRVGKRADSMTQSEKGPTKSLGKWQSAAKAKQGGGRKTRTDEVIPDSDEEMATENETTAREVRETEARFSGRGRSVGVGRGHVADNGGAQVVNGEQGSRVTRRTSGLFAKVDSVQEAVAMHIERESGAVKSGDVTASSGDVVDLRSDANEESRPPIVRTFSRKKRRVENGGVEEKGNGGGAPGKAGEESERGESQGSDPFDFVDDELGGSQKLSSQSSGQLREKRKFGETGSKSKVGQGALSREQISISKSGLRQDGTGTLDRRLSGNGKRRVEGKGGVPRSASLSAFDFETLEDMETPSLTSSVKNRTAGQAWKPRVKQEVTANPADCSEDEAAPSDAPAEGPRNAGYRLGSASVKGEVNANRVAKQGSSSEVGVERNQAQRSKGTREKDNSTLQGKTAVRSAFAFNPTAEERERKGWEAKNERGEETKVPARDLRQALDKGLVTECLVTSVKVLMNLTNDNADGCRQIAAAGGLRAIASLLVARCPLPTSGDQALVASGNSATCAPDSSVSGRGGLQKGGRENGKNKKETSAELAQGTGEIPQAGLGIEGGSESALAASGPAPQGGDVSSAIGGPKGAEGRPQQGQDAGNATDDVSKGGDVSRDVAVAAIGEGPSEDLDLITVVLALLINLVEKDRGNRATLAALDFPEGGRRPAGPLEGSGMVAFLCALFLSKKGAGARAESVENQVAALEMDDETRLAEGQREAEDMIVEAYAALLLALLAKDNIKARATVAERLPEGDASSLVPVLERFMNFHLRMSSITREAHEALLELIDSCKPRQSLPA